MSWLNWILDSKATTGSQSWLIVGQTGHGHWCDNANDNNNDNDNRFVECYP